MSEEEGGPLSATRWNARFDRLFSEARQQAERLHNMFFEDGHPPFTAPKPPEEQYMVLLGWWNTGDPQLFDSPRAMDALKKLSEQLGAPFPPPTPAPPAPPEMMMGAAPPIPGPSMEAAPLPVPPLEGPAFGV
jgi:hypothetical protein